MDLKSIGFSRAGSNPANVVFSNEPPSINDKLGQSRFILDKHNLDDQIFFILVSKLILVCLSGARRKRLIKLLKNEFLGRIILEFKGSLNFLILIKESSNHYGRFIFRKQRLFNFRKSK